MLSAHIAAAYAGPLAVNATLAGVSGRVMFEASGMVADGMVLEQPVCRLMASTWPAAKEGATLNIQHAAGPLSYKIREIQPLDDGAERLFVLARA